MSEKLLQKRYQLTIAIFSRLTSREYTRTNRSPAGTASRAGSDGRFGGRRFVGAGAGEARMTGAGDVAGGSCKEASSASSCLPSMGAAAFIASSSSFSGSTVCSASTASGSLQEIGTSASRRRFRAGGKDLGGELGVGLVARTDFGLGSAGMRAGTGLGLGLGFGLERTGLGGGLRFGCDTGLDLILRTGSGDGGGGLSCLRGEA